MKPRMIALTGCIGSGKSTVAKILSQEYSFDVVDCDVLAREVAEDSDVLAEISALLGKNCIVDGKLDRKKVRETVFADAELHKRYSALFFEKVKKLLQQRVEGLQTVFVEIPVISAFEWDWYEVWLVDSARDKCVSRVVSRDSVSEENVGNILSRQPACKTFTRIISNDGTVDDLRAQLTLALRQAHII